MYVYSKKSTYGNPNGGELLWEVFPSFSASSADGPTSKTLPSYGHLDRNMIVHGSSYSIPSETIILRYPLSIHCYHCWPESVVWSPRNAVNFGADVHFVIWSSQIGGCETWFRIYLNPAHYLVIDSNYLMYLSELNSVWELCLIDVFYFNNTENEIWF